MKNTLYIKWILAFTIVPLLSFSLISQNPFQKLSGMVTDKVTKEVLIGAHVQILDLDELTGTITNHDGEFELNDIPLGRIRVQCDYLGYESYISPSLVLNSAKQLFIEIEMEEASFKTSEVVIRAKSIDKKAQNELALLSARSFSVEETERYAGSIADPSRMAVSFAGVQSTNDLDNDIIVRGNSSIGILWRLEGIDIPNPNHFARRGSSGGGIGIFSVNMLSNSDFIFGALPAEYGNTISSVFDMKFRKGNREKNEFAFRAGILGLDFMSEGPIKKGKSSYLFNYRYSTLGILNKAGIHIVNANTDNTFTDLSFHLNFPSNNNKSIFQIWGIGGYSSEIHNTVPEVEEWKEFDNLTHTDFKTGMGVVGANYTHLINDKSYLKLRMAFMGDHITHNKDTVDLDFNRGYLLRERYNTTRLTNTIEYVKKVSPLLQYEIGAKTHLLGYELNYAENDRVLKSNIEYLDQESDGAGKLLLESYLQGSWKASDRIRINGGLHFMYSSLNDIKSMEPRLAINYRLTPGSNISLAYGLYSQALPIGAYFTHENNIDLPFMKSQHWVTSYSTNFIEKYKFTCELYYQKLSNIPIAKDSERNYWMLNDLVGYSKYELVKEGTGRNYGIDITLERFFDRGFFFIAAGSLYRSEYSLDGTNYSNSRYDGRFNTSLMFGKEIEFKNGNALQLGFRNLLYGGQRYASVDEVISEEIRELYEDPTSTLDQQNKTYWRSDLRIAYRKNKASYSWSLSLDIQNLLNIKNTRGEIWNFTTQSLEPKHQAGIIPIINFQIDF
jgi:hypothetical protein